MDNKAKRRELQTAYRQMIEPYSKNLQFAVTLTLKTSATIKVKRFANYGEQHFTYSKCLTEELLDGTVKRFSKLLTASLYGNQSKHKNKRAWALPLIITCVEGRKSDKRTHLHMAIGNVPAIKRDNFNILVAQTWVRCDFANKSVCVKPISDGAGWLAYITKEAGYADSDALDVVASTIPPFIQQSICTESRLLTA